MLIFAVLGYVALQLGIGWWASRRMKTEADYLIAGRNLGLFAVAMSLFATWFGAETVMGSSAAIAEGGLAEARAEPFGYFLALLLMGLFVAYRLRAGGYMTLGDFFRERFGAQSETWCVIANVLVSIIWAAAQMTALSLIVASLTDLPTGLTLAVSAVAVVVYTCMGGLLGDVVTDVVQGVILLVGLVVLLALIVGRAGGLAEAAALIPPDAFRLVAEGESWIDRLDAWAVPVLGSLVAVEAIGRFLGAKSARIARNGALAAAGIYLFAGLIPVVIGLLGPRLGLSIESGEAFLPSLAEQVLHPLAMVVFVGALLSAILSTVDSNLLAVSGLITRNGIDRLNPNASEARKLWSARAVTVGAGLVAWMIASSGEGIYSLIEWTSALGTSGVLVAFLIGAYSRFGDGKAAVAAVLAGFACNSVTMLAPAAMGRDEVTGAFLISIAGSLIAYVAVALLARGKAGITPTAPA